jgi:lactoylglutathione lyase
MPMKATSLNHVSLHAVDLQESVDFYVHIFGMERIPTPNFAFPVQWLRLGDQQLHLFVRDGTPPPQFHHVAFNVDDFEAIYQQAQELSLHDTTAFFSQIYELPDGSVQMYIRDPAGNLVEIDWPEVNTLDRWVTGDIKKLADTVPQEGDALLSTLYLGRHDGPKQGSGERSVRSPRDDRRS